MPVLEAVPTKTRVYRAKRRGARPARLAKTMPDLLKLWSSGVIDDEKFEAQCTLLVDKKAGRPVLRADDEVPDAEIPEGALWRWLAPPSGDAVGEFETDAKIKGLEAGYTPKDSTRGWHRGPHASEELEHPGARAKPERNAHRVKNHCVGRLTYNQFRRAVWGVNQKEKSANPAEREDCDLIKYAMDNNPLGFIIDDPDVALAYVRVADAPAPTFASECAVLAAGGVPFYKPAPKVDPEAEKIDPWDCSQVPEKIPGWSPTNCYVGTVKDSQTTGDVALAWTDNTVKHAMVFTSGSAYTAASFSLSIGKNGTLLTGEVTVRLYAGDPTGAQTTLLSGTVSILEIGTLVTYWFGGGTASVANATVYTLELTTTAPLDGSNYLNVYYLATGGGAGNQRWMYSGGAWAAQGAHRLNFATADNTTGGKFIWRADANSSTGATVKGAAIAATDTHTVTMGATLTFNQNEAFLQLRTGDTVGDQVTPAYLAQTTTYRYGSIVVNAGVTVTFDGNATATNSGLMSNPTSADTSSKDSTLTINGTAASPSVFTNSVGGYNTNNKWCCYWNYGVIAASGKYWELRYAATGSYFLFVGASDSYTTSTTHSLGSISFYMGAAGGTAGPGLVCWPNTVLTINLAFEWVVLNRVGAASNTTDILYYNGAGPWGAGTVASWFGGTVVPDPSRRAGLVMGITYVSSGIGNSYQTSGRVGPGASLPTGTVPTGLAIADRGDGSGGLATIDNIASYADTDEIIVTASDGTTVIGRGTKTEYTANSGIICPNVTMDVLRSGDKAKATSDLYVESGFSDPAAQWTPGTTSPATPGDISVARLSDTTARVTITNAAATDNKVYYSTVANGGDTWTYLDHLVGNGTVDITIPAATDVYIWMLRDNGVYSIISNVVKFNTSIGSGTGRVVALGFPRLLKQSEVDQSVPGEDRITCRYELGPLTLAGANLERGDYLPANTDRAIVASTWEILSSKEVPVSKEYPRHAQCVARKVRGWQDS